MKDKPEGSRDQAAHTPDFELPHHDVVHEGNWEEYAAKGLVPVVDELNGAQTLYGLENVFTGDAYDWDEKRPLHHKPGTGVYVTQEGLKHYDDIARRWKEQDRQRQSDDDPAAS